MKFIEKKCPNCNAKLEFKSTDTEVTCEYCRSSFVIEKEGNINKDFSDLTNDAFNLVYNNYRGIMGVNKAIFVIAGLFIMFVAVSMIIGVTTSRKKMYSNTNMTSSKQTQSLDELGYVTSYAGIDEELINDIRLGGINALDNKINFYVNSFMPSIVKSWEYKGSYFLTLKSETSSSSKNILYDIYEMVLKIDDKNVSYFGVVMNSNFKRVDGKVVTLNNTFAEAPRNELSNGKLAFGYISLNSVYNDLVGKNADNYSIETIGLDK